MKKTLFTALIAFTLTCSAQTFKFTSDNTKDMRTIADSIVSNAKRSYKFNSEEHIKDTYVYRLVYVNVTDSTDRFNVFYTKRMKGANIALEITGTPEYQFHSALGKFLDLFPFWKKFIDKASEPESASQQINDASINGKTFYLRDNTNYLKWEISMH